ncbi:MAG: hypothetical protein H7844_01965 [Nitrospirae bacterium YQR-1]
MVLLSLILIIVFFHVYKLGQIPTGFHIDETSIANNAYAIAKTGTDEYGFRYPLYFRAFGEYKNPVYIYVSAFLYKFIVFSEGTLRLASVVFFMVFLSGFYMLVKAVFPESRLTHFYALVSAGFLPCFFAVSRVAFEAVSVLALIVWFLYFTYITYEKGKLHIYAFITGLILGFSIYTYTSMRLLAFLMAMLLVFAYRGMDFYRRNLFFIAGLIPSLIVFLVFTVNNTDAVMSRFNSTTYLYDDSTGIFEKIFMFIKNYLLYFSIDFLVLKGDVNLLFNTASMGVLFIPVFILFIFSIFIVFKRKMYRNEPFTRLLILFLIVSPVTGALTIDAPHTLRALLTGVFILIFSCYGFNEILKYKKKILLVTIVFSVTALQCCYYLYDYFYLYPQRSLSSFYGYGFKYAFRKGIDYNPSDFKMHQMPLTYVNFYKTIFENEGTFYSKAKFIPAKGKCILYDKKRFMVKTDVDQFCGGSNSYDDGLEDSIFRVRCCKE